MENLLTRFAEPDANVEELFVRLVDLIRPGHPDDVEAARRNLKFLGLIFEKHPETRASLRRAILHIHGIRRHSMLYTTSGILPNTGFLNEIFRRICDRFLPEALDPAYLRSFFRRVFCHSSDYLWVAGVGEEAWLELVGSLRFDEEKTASTELPHSVSEILRSLRIVSYWIAASGLEPELLRLDPDLDVHESPFTAQNTELNAYLGAYVLSWKNPANPGIDDKHLHVLFGQCREVIDRIQNRAARDGTSIRLTYHLRRLSQLIQRCEDLLNVAENLRIDPEGQSARQPLVRLFMSLVCEECRRDDIMPYWRQNTELIALRITENASVHGEHYIAENMRDYVGMARSALIGGGIIAFMAALKLLIGKTDLPPLMMALAYCLNYGLGFCLIHVLHGTVATKQPAMTANAIAACVESAGGRLYHIESIAELVARTFRTQMVAIFGNVLLAISLSWGVAYLFFLLSGQYFIPAEKAAYLLQSQSVTRSGAICYAAIAGICLFLAGLINGYFDNYVAYNRVAERILQLEWLRRTWGAHRAQRIAVYIGRNFGALSGNFLFGFLIGGATLMGLLTGLPIDIRHVTFSSAYVGLAAVSLDFSPVGINLLWAMFDVAVVGFFNLTVSFALAFHVALRSRRIEYVSLRQLAGACARFLREHPGEFFFPPR